MTLTARLSDWLIEQGHSVDVLVLTSRETASKSVIELFSDNVQLHFVDRKYRYLPWYPLNLRRWAGSCFDDLDVIVALSREALFVSASLYPAFKTRPIIIPYVIDNVAFTRTVTSRSAKLIRKHFVERIPNEFKMFMSQTVRTIHAKSLNVDFDDSKVLILPVKLKSPRKLAMPKRQRIVAIARIDNAMKRYVHQLPAIIANLRRRELQVTCDIYGHGEAASVDELYRVIQQNNVQDWVEFHGEVKYSRFDTVLQDCFAFVGMGTSAIEAAMLGIPTIVATAFSEWPKSYGYLNEYPMGALGEDLEREGARDIETMIADLCGCSESRYLDLCRSHVEYASRYEEGEICRDMLAYFQSCIDSEYRSFEMPIRQILTMNFMRGTTHLKRWLSRTIVGRAFAEGRRMSS